MNHTGYSSELIGKFYLDMLTIRLCEESFVSPILNNEIRGPVHLYTGQEAIAVGVCATLNRTDYVFGTHRSHGHFLAKGGSLCSLISEVYGRESGCSRGRGGSMHLCDPSTGMMGAAPIVAGTISLALGSALASWIRKEKKVSVSFFGDGATGEGVLYESLNFAALKKLPIIFVCENNFYSTHMRLSDCRLGNNIVKTGLPFCVPSFSGDGNDVLVVYEIAKKAVKICRDGNGPVFIEFRTYRMRGHVGPDDNIHGKHTDIRPESEIAKWKKKDPIKRLRKYILKNKIIERSELDKIEQRVSQQVEDAHELARKSPMPKEKELDFYVYG